MAVKGPSPGAFVGGLFAGFAAGGFVLMPALVLTVTTIFNRFSANPAYGFILIYIIGAALGACALWRIRERLDFLTGFLGGGAAGLLGLAALCNMMLGGLGH